MNEIPDRASKSGHRYLFGLIALLALALVVWVVFGQVLPRLTVSRPLITPPSPSAAQLADLQAELDRANAKIKALEDTVAASKPSDTDAKITALQAKVDALTRQPAASGGTPGARFEQQMSGEQQALQALSARIDALEASNARRLTALASFDQIKDAVRHGNPFALPLATLTQATADNAKAQAIARELAPYAGKGVPDITQLQAEFERAIPAALASGNEGGFLHALRTLVSIRRIGNQAGTGDEAVIARAEVQLNNGNVENAAGELSGLSAGAARTFAPWMAKAQAMLKVQGALTSLQPALLENTSAFPPPAKSATP